MTPKVTGFPRAPAALTAGLEALRGGRGTRAGGGAPQAGVPVRSPRALLRALQAIREVMVIEPGPRRAAARAPSAGGAVARSSLSRGASVSCRTRRNYRAVAQTRRDFLDLRLVNIIFEVKSR